MDVVISISFYILAIVITYGLVNRRYRYSLSRGYIDDGSDSELKVQKITITLIILIGLLFVLYNVLVTKINPSTTSDRRNYTLNFYGYRASPSAGLTFIINIIRMFSSNVEVLFYVTTFISMVITLWAYKISKEATPNAVLFLLATQYVFFTFAGLKQSYANALAAICIVLALRNKGIKDTIFGIISIIAAIWFHHTGYFLIPLFVMLKIKKTRKTIIWFFVFMVFIVLFLEPILVRTASLISPFATTFSGKIVEYFGETSSEGLQTEGALTFIKGFPFYVITIVGCIKRKKLIDAIDNYDNYLFISGILSFIYLATVYNGWVYRLSYFLYLPVGIFYGQIMQYYHKHNNKLIIDAVVFGATFILTIRFVVLMYINYGGF